MSSRYRAPASFLAFVLAVMLALAGCGDDGGQPASTATTTTSSTATEQAGDSSSSGGGEKSIEEFGTEAEGSEQEAIVGSFKTYLGAIATGDLAKACFYLASSVQESLEQLAKGDLAHKGCAAILPKILAPTAAGTARTEAEGEITKVRVDGDRAFVVFHAPGAKLFQMTMVRENGRWKVANVSAAILVPDL